MAGRVQRLKVQRASLADQVAESIKEAILDGTLSSGQHLTATEVGEWLGVSRTPVREAFLLLQRNRLVEKESSRSFVVASWNKTDLLELAQLRTALEVLAIELAIPRITPEDIDLLESLVGQMEAALSRSDIDRLVRLDIQFHSTVWGLAGNSRLQQILDDLQTEVEYLMLMTRPGDETDYPRIHRELIQAIKKGDIQRAQEETREHILSSAERAIARLEAAKLPV